MFNIFNLPWHEEYVTFNALILLFIHNFELLNGLLLETMLVKPGADKT